MITTFKNKLPVKLQTINISATHTTRTSLFIKRINGLLITTNDHLKSWIVSPDPQRHTRHIDFTLTRNTCDGNGSRIVGVSDVIVIITWNDKKNDILISNQNLYASMLIEDTLSPTISFYTTSSFIFNYIYQESATRWVTKCQKTLSMKSSWISMTLTSELN